MDTSIVKYNVTDAAIAEMAKNYLPMKINGLDDKVGLQMVHAARIAVKNKRVEVERTRKELKADALRYTQAVDAEARRITALLAPIEEHLEREEQAIVEAKAEIKRKAEAELDRIAQERVEAMAEAGEILPFLEARSMDVGTFQTRLKVAHEILAEQHRQREIREEAERRAREQAEAELAEQRRKLEAERLAQEQAAQAIEKQQRIEREKLEAERAEQRRKMEEERSEQEKRRRAIEEQQAAEQEKIKAERAAIQREIERLEGIRKAREAEAEAARIAKEIEEKAAQKAQEEIEAREAARIQAEQEAARQEALRPDREKLEDLADRIIDIDRPKLDSEQAMAILAEAVKKLGSVERWIRKQALELN